MKVALVLVILVLSHGFSSAQAAKETKAPAAVPVPAPAPTPKPPDPHFVQWRVYLDTLAQETRSVPNDRRPYATTDVALAYLDVDRNEAMRLLMLAVDEAYKYRQEDPKKYEPMLRYVLNTASKNGSDIATALAARVKKLVETDLDKGGKQPFDPDGTLPDGARSEEPARRAELAKALAPRGLKEGPETMQVIFELARTHPALADDVYLTYLQKAETDRTIPLGALLQLAGYPFGYGETLYYSESRGSSWSGGGKVQVDPRLAPAFIAFMHRRIQNTIDHVKEGSMLTSNEGVNLLFAIQLVSLELGERAPEMVPVWHDLGQQAVIGRTPAQIKAASDRIAEVLKWRAGSSMLGEGPNVEEDAETRLADIEKVPDSCQRDIKYSQSVIDLRLKNPGRAEELTEKMSDKARAANLRDIVNALKIPNLVQSNEFELARSLASKMTTPLVKATAYGDLTKELYAKKQVTDAASEAAEAQKLIEKIEAADRPMMYFGLSVVQANADYREAILTLEKGIKALNKLEPTDAWRHKNLMEVELSCPGQGRSMWATSGSFNQSSVLDAVRALVKQDLDAVNAATEMIADRSTKLRAQAIIARAALAKFKPK